MSFARILLALSLVILAGAAVGAGQTGDGLHSNVFRSDTLGMTYTFPEQFSPKAENDIRFGAQDPSGREHLILALWNPPDRSAVPRMAFLYDTKVRPAGLSREKIANNYLAAVRDLWAKVQGVKIAGPKRISPAEYPIWRLDLWQPDTLPHYNVAIAIPLADRRILAIQINAPSQSELDAEVDSLREMHFDKGFDRN